MRIGYSLLSLGFLSLCAVSCVDKAYDMDKLQEMNTDINFGGDQFSIPIGSLEPILLGRFIKAGDMLRLTEGRYELAYENNQTTTIPTIAPIDFTVNTVPVAGIPVNLGDVSINDIDLPTIKIDKSVEQTIAGGGGGVSTAIVQIPNTLSPINILYEYSREIKQVNYVVCGAPATEGERLELALTPNYGTVLTNGSTTIDNFSITFPYGFTLVADPSDPYGGTISTDNKSYSVAAKTLQPNQKISFFVQKITFDPSVDQTEQGLLHYDQHLTFSGTFTLSGTNAGTGSVGISLHEERLLTLQDGNFHTNTITAKVPTQETPVGIDEPIDDPSLINVRKVALKQRTKMDIVLNVNGLPDRVDGLTLKDYTVRFPDFMVFEDPVINASKTLVVNEAIPNNGSLNKAVYLTGFLFKDNPIHDGKLVVEGQVTSSGGISIAPINNLSETEVQNVVIKPAVTVGAMEVGSIEAVVQPNVLVEPIEIKVDLASGMDFLTNSVLDLAQVALHVRVENTTGVAAKIGVRLTPFAQSNEPLSQNIVEQETGLPITPKTTTEFWLSNSAVGAPAGAVFVENKRTPHLFRTLPSKVEALLSILPDELSSVIDLTKPQSGHLKIYYALVAPIAVGKDFHLVYKERVTGLHSVLSDLLQYARGVELSVQAQSSIPLDLSLSAVALDEAGNAIPVSIKTDGTIISGTKEGGYTPSNLTLSLTEREPGALIRLDKIDLIFNGLANPSTVGVSLQETQALKIQMNAKVPGGININLKP